MKYTETKNYRTGEIRVTCNECDNRSAWKNEQAQLTKWQDNHICPEKNGLTKLNSDFSKMFLS